MRVRGGYVAADGLAAAFLELPEQGTSVAYVLEPRWGSYELVIDSDH